MNCLRIVRVAIPCWTTIVFCLILSTLTWPNIAYGQSIGPGHTALWHVPERSGEGWVLEVLDDDEALVYWFTFDEDGEQRWLMGVGHIEGNRITFEQLHSTHGGRLGETDPDDVERLVVGEAEMVFESCDRGVIEYDAYGQSQMLEIERLTVAAGLDSCDSTDSSTDPRAGLTGTWYDPARSGEGFILQWLNRAEGLLIWFTYDDTGNQQWIIGTGQLRDEDIVFSDLHTARGTRFGEDFDANEVERDHWGELKLTLDCGTGIVHWSSAYSEFGGGQMEIQPLTRLDALDCDFKPNIWSSSGPYGDDVEFIATSPDNPERVYAGGRYGIFRSDDEGKHWQDITTGLPTRAVRALAVSPHNADEAIVALANGRLFKSENAGLKWRPLDFHTEYNIWSLTIEFSAEDPETITVSAYDRGIHRSYDGGRTWSWIGIRSYLIHGFSSLSSNPNVMIASAGSVFFKSTNGGQEWVMVEQPVLYSVNRPYNLSDTADGRFVFTYKNEIFWSDDEGSSWRKHQFEDCEVQEDDTFWINNVFVVHPQNPDIWFFGGEDKLFKTMDGGLTCSRVGAGESISENPNFWPYVLTFKPGDPDTLMVGTAYQGFFYSNDGGENWQNRNEGLQQERIRTVAVNPVHENIVYAGTDITSSMLTARFWISDDRGVSWKLSSNGPTFGGLRAIAADPFTAASPETTHIYAAGYGRYPGEEEYVGAFERNPVVFKSTDGGVSWFDSAEGIAWTNLDESSLEEFHGTPLMRSIVLDPSSGLGGDGPLQTLYVAGKGFITRENGELVIKAHRIYKSTDAGAHWVPSDQGLPVFINEFSGSEYTDSLQVMSLAIDPTRPQTLYAGIFLEINSNSLSPISFTSMVDNGVFKSTDGGANWFHSSEGLPRHDENNPESSHWDVFALVVAPSEPDVLYAAASPLYDKTAAYRDDPVWRRGSKIFKSLDAGANWTEASVGIPPDADIRGLVVDPDDAEIVYASNDPTDEHPGLVFRTTDGGKSWAVYDTGISAPFANSLVVGPGNDHPMLFVGTRGGVFRRRR